MESLQTTPIADWVSDRFYWVMIVILIINLMQRRHQARAEKKRFATLYLALAVFLIYTGAELVRNYGGGDLLFLGIGVVVVLLVVVFHEHTFPFRLRSARDGRLLNTSEILFDDKHGDGDSQDTDVQTDTQASESDDHSDTSAGAED